MPHSVAGMHYRRFGKTELSMPVFSCGGMRYQHKWQDVKKDDVPETNQKNLEATIHRALEVGIHHIETARGYGSSEMQLGYVLRNLPRDSFILQTKIGPSEDPDEFLKNFETSFDYLGLDYIDLLGIHGINESALLDYTLKKNGCLDAARELQKQGRVRHIGFSTHGSTDVICRAIDSGEFDYVNLHWYWIFQNNWPAIELAAKKDLGVFIISPNDKGGRLYDPSPILEDCCAPLSPMAFNDLFCLSHPQVHTLSIGASRPSDFDAHIEALNSWDQRDSLVTEAQTRLHHQIEKTVGMDWYENHAEGLPTWSDVPKNINFKLITWLWTLHQSLGMTEYAKARYNMLGNAGHWFPGENAEQMKAIDLEAVLKDSPYKSEISERLFEAHQLFKAEAGKRLSSV
ncbi:MAG: aldo/keto reductase [Verrucomicrobiota bacterium]